MEFLRFGSSIPGAYWGCCACCIIQNFKVDPDAKASIQIVNGDAGSAVGDVFAGPTWRDIFWQRLRFGTFDKRPMPNHAFLAILTQSQIDGTHGAAWLAILKEAGFEFIRTVCNSVYAGQTLAEPKGNGSSRNYIFGLFRNIGNGAPEDQFIPPQKWLDLPSVGKTETYDFVKTSDGNGIKATRENYEADLAVWKATPELKLLTKAQVKAAGAPVILAGQRSKRPQQTEEARAAVDVAEGKAAKSNAKAALSPLSPAAPVPAPATAPASV